MLESRFDISTSQLSLVSQPGRAQAFPERSVSNERFTSTFATKIHAIGIAGNRFRHIAGQTLS
jgi:hypothetical protein